MARLNVGGAAGGATSGAITGAAIGSIVPGVGTGIGAAAGGVLGGVSGLFGGKRKPKKRSTLDPAARKLYDEYIASIRGEGPMGGMYNFDANAANENFNKNVAEPAYQQFNENVIPQITGQFRGQNIGNSSYTGEALSRAGRDVQRGLDAQRSNVLYQGGQDALNRKQRAIEHGLGVQTFAYDTADQGGGNVIDQILNSVGPEAAKYLINSMGGGGTSTPSTPTVPTGGGEGAQTLFRNRKARGGLGY